MAFQATWNVAATGTTTNDVGVRAAGSDLAVTVNGSTSTRPAATVSNVAVSGGSGADHLTVDPGGGAITAPVSFDGGGGANSVKVATAPGSTFSLGAPGAGTATAAGTGGVTFTNVSSVAAEGPANTLVGPAADTTWTLTGPNSGTLGALAFSGFQNLTGAANNRDTFVVGTGGSLSGLIDGGAGGFDTLVIDGTHASVTSSATGPNSGTVTVDGHPIRYVGLEPIVIASAANVTVTGSSTADHITIKPDPASPATMLVAETPAGSPTMESVSFTIPTASLTVDAGGGDDVVTLQGTLLLPGVNLVVTSERIVVTSGTTLDTGTGTITLQAANSQSATAPLPLLPGALSGSATASVSITSAAVSGGNIDVSAASAVDSTSPAESIVGLLATSEATVDVVDSAIAADGNLSLAAGSTVTSALAATAAPTDGSTDAAVSGSDITSTATSRIRGASAITVSGDLAVSATNVVSATTTGDASGVSKGAGIAISNVTQTTQASISGSTTVSANTSTVSADSDGTVTTTAKASPGGANANNETPNARTAGNARTADGNVTVVGALSFSRLTATTDAHVAADAATPVTIVTGTREQKVHAASKARSSAAADGSAVGPGGSGLGVAVAVNLANVTTTAHVGTASLTASRVTVEAQTPATPTFAAQAVSGVGDSSGVTVAGALSVAVTDFTTQAAVDPSATVGAAGTDLALNASSGFSSSVEAKPAVSGGAKTGIGASVAVHSVDDSTQATLGDGSSVTARDVTLDASTTGRSISTKAEGGAAGGTAITPVAALTFSNLSTAATVGTGVTLGVRNFAARANDGTTGASTLAEGDATGTTTAVGAALALSLADHSVTATTASGFTATGTAAFTATGTSSTGADARASANGAPQDGSGSATTNLQVAQQRSFGDGVATANGTAGGGSAPAAPPANSSSGEVAVAAAISVNIAKTSSTASIPLGITVGSTGLLLFSSASSDAKANADGSATAARAPPLAIGAAVAINYATVTNSATVAGTANGPATVRALVTGASDGRHDFAATATSGAGGGKLSVAGSFALNIVHLHTDATVTGTGTVAAGSGGVELSAASNARSQSLALPAQGGASGASKLGLGAAVALNFVEHTTRATVADGATISGHDLSLSAASADDMSTDARTGAAGGGVALAPAVAVALSNVTASSTVGTGGLLTIGGAFGASADQTASARTNAEGDTKGASAAVGFALALTIANHLTESTLSRDLTAGGAVGLAARGSSDSSSSATASAAGAPGDASGGGHAGNGVDQQVAAERSLASATDSSTGGSGAATDASPSASTSQGGVSVAAAIAINLATTTSRATIGAVTVTAGALFTLSTAADTDAFASADGSAARGPSDASAPADSSGGAGAPSDSTSGASIGAGVAINYAKIRNEAILPAGANVTSDGATIEALMRSTHELGASATSGAGGGAVGVAGSVAIDIENTRTSASIIGSLNAGHASGGGGGAGKVRVKAVSVSKTVVDALPAIAPADGSGSASSGVTSHSFGVGASVALAAIDDTTTASLTGTLTGATDLSLTAETAHSADVRAKTGAAGGKVAIVPSVAIALSNVTTLATVSTGAPLDMSGGFSASATQAASANTTAEGDAQGGSAAIGVSLALTIANHRSEATLLRNLDAAGDVALSAHGASESSATATASAAGAPQDESGGGHAGNGVDQQVSRERSFASDASAAAGGDGSGGAASTPSASTSSGGVNVAAAVAINLAQSISRATIGAITARATGRFTLSTSANTDARATADGSAVGSVSASAPEDASAPADSTSGGVSIGAAVAINFVRITNEASLPAGATVTANGATIEAAMSSQHELGASATSGAGGGSVGVAGSVAIEIERTVTAASLAGVLNAAGGAVNITAESSSMTGADALPAETTDGVSAGSVGIGASVAIALVDETTTASLTGTLNGGGNLSVAAATERETAVHAKTGAAGGDVAIVPSVAIALSNVTTTATVGGGTDLSIGGAFSASADQTASAATTAEGDAQGADAAVGLSLALTIANHRAEATLARNLTAAGAVSLSANGSSVSSASATASASGAPGESSGGASGDGVDQEVAAQRGYANATRQSTGGGSSDGGDPTPQAATNSGGVNVAAAVAINLAKTSSLATLIGPIALIAGGRFTLATSSGSDATASADGRAVTPGHGSGVSIGVAVAINYARIRNEAILPGGDTVTSNGATIQALRGSTNDLGASAKSGAGGGKVGIAGSVAIDIENVVTRASLAGSLNAGSGDVMIFASSDSASDVAATPAQASVSSTPQAFDVLGITDVNPDSSDLHATDPNGASGGRVNGIGAVPGNNQIFYAATEWGGLYKTIDGGVTWSFLPGHRPMATWDVEVDPSNTQRVYATSLYDGRVSSIAGINVSTDGGTTWTHPATAIPSGAFNCAASRKGEPSAFGIGIRPGAPNNVFVGTNCGVAISTDSGLTWTFVDPSPTTPAGDVWDVVVQAGGPTGQGIVDICGADGHFRSTSGGLSWTGTVGLPGTAAGEQCSIAVSPDESYVLFAVVGTNIYESDDAGATWPSQLTNPSPQGRVPFVATNQRSNVLGVDHFDLWFADVSLHRADCTTPAAKAPGGAPRCPTNTWAGPFTSTVGAHDDAGDLVFDTQAPIDACPRIFSSDGGVYRNTDTTATCQSPTWTQPTRSPHALWLFGMAGVNRAGATAEELYLALQDDGLWATANAGATSPTWHNDQCCDAFDLNADENRVVSTECCFNTAPGLRMFVRGTGLAGGGEISAASRPPGNLIGFRPMDSLDRFGDKKYVIVTTAGVFFTNDITAPTITWTPIAGAPAGACAVRAADTAGSAGTPTFYVQAGICNERNMARNGDQLWRYTGTSGGTWTRIDGTVGMTGGIGIFAVDPKNSDRLYASNMRPAAQGGPRMVSSTNAGAGWTQDSDLDAMMTGHGVFKYATRRGPSSFTDFLGYPQPTLLAFDPSDSNIVIAGGRDSGVFLSTNGGADWRLITDPFQPEISGVPHLPRPWFAHFEHLSATDVDIYVGTQGRGVWRFRIHLNPGGTGQVGVGIGASVAVGLVDDTTTATLTGTLTGGDDLTISASTQHLLGVRAKTG
ncbi:MAG TPA: hypothetical protein VGR87_08260, partial [Candidatus Limnocylindria bacterium]|nr:hypothetical protein [Candidatus Limnocylindria bacterium]